MKRFVEIGRTWDHFEKEKLEKLGLKVDAGFSRIQMNEDQFLIVEKTVDLSQAIIGRGTNFTNKDLSLASQGYIRKLSTKGYPQPEGDFGYLNKSYDLTNYCKGCGVGAEQINSLRILSEIPWKKPGIINLHWIYDQLLIEKTTYLNLLKPLGIGFIPVVIDRTSKESDTTVQIDIKEASEDLEIGVAYVKCKECNRKKYKPEQYGFFKGYIETPKTIIHTKESYGQDGLAYKRIVLPKNIFQLLLENKIIMSRNIVPSND